MRRDIFGRSAAISFPKIHYNTPVILSSPAPSFEDLARNLLDLTAADQVFVYRGMETNSAFDPVFALGTLSLQEKQAFWGSQFDPAADPIRAKLDLPGVVFSNPPGEAEAGSALAVTRAQSILLYPLQGREQLVGLVIVGWLRSGASLPEGTAVLSSALVRAMALEIENDRMQERSHQQAQQARIAQEITQSILRRDALDGILRFIASEAMRAVDALGCCIRLFDESGLLQPAAQVGEAFPSPLDGLRRGAGAHPRDPEIHRLDGTPWNLEEPGIVLTIPMYIQSEAVGFFEVRQVEAYARPKDRATAAAFASQAAVAVELARLYQRLQQTAVAEERARLARDLHDSISQSLYAITLYARAAQRRLSEGSLDAVEKHINELALTSREVLGEMRLLIFELRPMALQQYGLKGILEQRLQTVEARSGLETHLDIRLTSSLPAPVEENLYHIALEALNNAIKHAQAGRVSLSLTQDERAIHLSIHDDGVGFAPASLSDGGLGLKNIQERVRGMNGQLTIQSEPGAGTTVAVEVPYDNYPNFDR